MGFSCRNPVPLLRFCCCRGARFPEQGRRPEGYPGLGVVGCLREAGSFLKSRRGGRSGSGPGVKEDQREMFSQYCHPLTRAKETLSPQLDPTDVQDM